jgi:flagellar basal body-associated protein FliL
MPDEETDMNALRKPLSTKATVLILAVVLAVAGGGFYYFWNFMGKQEGKSLAEVMKFYNKPEYQQPPGKSVKVNPIPSQFAPKPPQGAPTKSSGAEKTPGK